MSPEDKQKTRENMLKYTPNALNVGVSLYDFNQPVSNEQQIPNSQQGGQFNLPPISDYDRSLYNVYGSIFNAPDYQYGDTQEVEQQRSQNIALKRLQGSLRGAADLLEPLNLLKDVMDGAIAAGLDDETTLSERMSRLNFGAYFDAYNPAAFWSGNTQLAGRAATGKEILGLLGSENKIFNNVAGFVYDVAADPLLIGGMLGASGKILSTAGRGSVAATNAGKALTKAGRSIDDYLSLTGAYGKLGKVAPEVTQLIERKVQGVIEFIIDPQRPFNVGVQNILDRTLPRKTALNLNMGSFGEDLFKIQGRSEQLGDDFFEEVTERALNAESALLGITNKKKVFRDINKSVRQFRTQSKNIEGMPKILHASIQREAVRVVDNLGLAAQTRSNLIPDLRSSFDALDRAGVTANVDVLEDAVKKIREVAVKQAVDPELAARRFKKYALDMSELDAFIGLKMTGLPEIEKALHLNLSKLGANSTESLRVWEDMLTEGVSGNFEAALSRPTTIAPRIENFAAGMISPQQAKVKQAQLLNKQVTRVTEARQRIENNYRKKIMNAEASYTKLVSGNDQLVQEGLSNLYSKSDELMRLSQERNEWVERGFRIPEDQILNTRGGLSTREVQSNIARLDQQIQRTKLSYQNAKQALQIRRANSAQNIGKNGKSIESKARTLEKQMERDLASFDQNPLNNIAKIRKGIIASTREQVGDVLTYTNRNDDVSSRIIQKRIANGEAEADALRRNFTLGEIIGEVQEFQSLPLGTYFEGLKTGHMRNVLGMFLSDGGAESYIRGAARGKILPTNIIDEGNLPAIMGEREAGLITDYIQTVAGGENFLLNKSDLVTHLLNNGLSGQEARRAVGAMIEDANPALKDFVKELEEVAARYERPPNEVTNQPLVSLGSDFNRERQEIDSEFLLKLGQLANPLVSITESASAARVRIPMQKFLGDVYFAAKEQGMVSTTHKDGFTKLGESTYWREFADTWVHPQLKKELLRGMLKPNKRGGVLSHTLNMITSGYLAAPNVIFGNVMGGVYTSAAAGLNPFDMVTGLARNFGKLRKYTADSTHDDMIDLLKENVNLNLGSQVTQLFAKNMRDIRLEKIGLEPEGFEKVVQQLSGFFEGQLKKPLGQAWAGLEGFQWAENWLKVTAFDVGVSDNLRKIGRTEMIGDWKALRESIDPDIQKAIVEGAEKARIAVFDYSEMPDTIKTLQRTGVVIFPGFNYFSAGRAMSAVVNKPAVIGSAERIPDALSNAMLDEDDRWRLFAGMDDWLKEEGGAPIKVTRDEQGNRRVSVIPMSQLIPSSTFSDTKWLESLASGGIYKPAIEAIMAHLNGDGEAIFSGRFGQQVFDQTEDAGTKLAQTTEFILSNITPTIVRKLGLTPQDIRSIAENESSRGIVGTVRGANFRIPEELGDGMLRLDEEVRGKAMRSTWDEIIALTIRAPQTYALEGRYDAMARQYDINKRSHDVLIREFEWKADSAYERGEFERGDNYIDKAIEKDQDFIDEWSMVSELAGGF